MIYGLTQRNYSRLPRLSTFPTNSQIDDFWEESCQKNIGFGPPARCYTSSTSFNVTGLTVGESNWYSVRARNTSGITGRRANAIKHEHGTTPGCTGCVTTITNFPYVEGFESGFGDFCQNSNDGTVVMAKSQRKIVLFFLCILISIKF